MFYSQFILAKKGPLGTIWIAAHLERKLRKNQVADTDIGVSVDSILFPEVPIALRLSSHLLLGVVRIYSRKVNYLFDDCSEALLKVKQAFRSTTVDLPPEESTAPYHSITLPETFDLDDFELPDNDIIQGNFVDHHVSTREQITLQDTMDGVVYSTSQFGLDERFGDGDTSQIGLDLDEELLLEKAATSRHGGVLLDSFIDPQATVQTSSLHRGDDCDEEISEASKALPTSSFNIQAPSTPGLVEEPNLPTQEAQVSDDHMDEDHNPAELVTKEVSGAACGEPAVYHVDNGAVLPPADNGCLLDDQEVEKATSQGEPPLEVDPVELVVPSYIQPSSVTNGLDKLENIQNGIPSDNQPNFSSAFQAKAEYGDVEVVGMDGNAAMLIQCQKAPSVLELPASDPCTENVSNKSHTNGFCFLTSDSVSESTKSVLEPGFLKPVGGDSTFQNNSSEPEITDSQACLKPQQSEILCPDAHEKMSSPSIPIVQAFHSELDGAHERMLSASVSVLQACSSHLDDANTGLDSSVSAPKQPTEDFGLPSSGISAGEDAADISGASTIVQDVMKPTMEANQTLDPMSFDVTGTNKNKLDGQPDRITPRDSQLDKENEAAALNLPSPEKLLSLPDLPAGQPNDLLVDSTPSKEVLEGDGDSVVNQISGRKRSFTESTLTLQSINSAESFGATQSKKSVEFIPDDDDLLSSILVGRRSTVLKVKPTPPVPEIVSVKRRRVAPRPSPVKRKVLMDDMMVLHGDTIRQQLMNTEDIRRVRKKAPCTRPEIWMLQKQFLEDEIFTEPIFTGMLPELISLHSQTFDLSRTRIFQDEGSTAHTVTVQEMESCMSQGVVEEPVCKENYVPSAARDDVDRQCAKALDETPNQQIVNPPLGLDDNFAEEMRTIDTEPGHINATLDNLQERSEIEIDSRVDPVSDVGNHSVDLEAKLSSFDPVSLDNGAFTDGAIQSGCFDRTEDASASLQVEVPCQSPDQELDFRSVGKDASVNSYAPMVGINEGVAVDTSAAEELDKDRLDVGTQDGQFQDQMEAVNSFVAGAGNTVSWSLHANDANTFAAMPNEGRALAADQVFMEGTANELELTNENPVFGSAMQYDDGRTVDHHSGDLKLHSSLEADVDVKNAMLAETHNQECQEAEPQFIQDPTTIPFNHAIREEHFQQDFDTDRFEHDTDFLNFDDDDIAEEEDSSLPNVEEGRILDNSGWSARTRAVANYLQVLFHKEAEQGRKALHLDNLLAGKSRKEASRMFFETLVLKTRDYVHAEQAEPFGNISIKPRVKLMKSEF
ncbi:hypothetical protein Ancab_000250 [Ancistrocladus abbreviatus]